MFVDVVALLFIFVSLHLRSVLQLFFIRKSCTRTTVSESKPECGFFSCFVHCFQWHVFVVFLCGRDCVLFRWPVFGFDKCGMILLFCCVGDTLNFSRGLILAESSVVPKFSDDEIVMNVFGHVIDQFWGEETREPHLLECGTRWLTCPSVLGRGDLRTTPWQVVMVPCDLGVAPSRSAVFSDNDVARVGRNVARVGRNVARVGWSLVDLCRVTDKDVHFWGCETHAQEGRSLNFEVLYSRIGHVVGWILVHFWHGAQLCDWSIFNHCLVNFLSS